jgi:deoxyribodipyrimidine photo-lyase
MNDALTLLRQRSRRLNDKPIAVENREYILCWLQQALRAEQNPIIDAAIALGNEHNLPVVVYHGLDNRYPHASHRLHRFILEASQSLSQATAARGLRFCRYVRRPERLEEGLVYRLCERAAALVTDDMPTFVARYTAVFNGALGVARKHIEKTQSMVGFPQSPTEHCANALVPPSG